MLEYDNSAFYYFTLSLISIYLVPVTLVSLKQVWLKGRLAQHLVCRTCSYLPRFLYVDRAFETSSACR